MSGQRVELPPSQQRGHFNFIFCLSSLLRLFRVRPQQTFQERNSIAEIRDDDVGTYAKEASAFPFIEPTRAVVRFVARDGHGQTTDFLGVFDLNIAIAK